MLDPKLCTYKRIRFEVVFTYPGHISKEEAAELQTHCGYHPVGYGGPNKLTHDKDGSTTWYVLTIAINGLNI